MHAARADGTLFFSFTSTCSDAADDQNDDNNKTSEVGWTWVRVIPYTQIYKTPGVRKDTHMCSPCRWHTVFFYYTLADAADNHADDNNETNVPQTSQGLKRKRWHDEDA